MQLNIKNEDTYRLAQQLAQMTGENVTQAIKHALQARIDQLHQQAQKKRHGLAARMLQMGEDFAALPDLDARSGDDILYDENGLPRDSVR